MLFLILIFFAFISLDLADTLEDVSWPVVQSEFQVPFSFTGIVSMVISGRQIISSLLSDDIILVFGTGKVTLVGVMMNAPALLGFSLTPSFVCI